MHNGTNAPAKCQRGIIYMCDCTQKVAQKIYKITSYPLGFPGPGLGGFQVTLISEEEILYAFTSDGASLGSV